MNCCNFCNKKFETKQTLLRHQKTAKFCLKIQRREDESSDDITCYYCEKKFPRKERLLSHLKICKNKNAEEIKNIIENCEKKLKEKDENCEKKLKEKDENFEKITELYKIQINKLEEKVEDLQDKLQQICFRAIDKPTVKTINNNNTTTNNTLNLQTFFTPEFIRNKIGDKFSDAYIHNKMRGVADFVHDHIVMSEDGKLLYRCYDVSRGIFKYKDDKGNEIKDVKALKLIKIIQPDLMKRATDLHKYFADHCEYLTCKLDYIPDDEKGKVKEELDSMKILRDKALDVGFEINTMNENNNFSNELATVMS